MIRDIPEIVRLEAENASVKRLSEVLMIVLLVLMDTTITRIASLVIAFPTELSKYCQIQLVIMELLYNTPEYRNPNLIFPGLTSVAFPSVFLILVRSNVHAS